MGLLDQVTGLGRNLDVPRVLGQTSPVRSELKISKGGSLTTMGIDSFGRVKERITFQFLLGSPDERDV